MYQVNRIAEMNVGVIAGLTSGQILDFNWFALPRKLADLRKKAVANIGTETGDIGTAGIIARLVQLHQKQR
jgi:hypothetical protein